ADIHLTMDTIRQIPLFHYLSYKELVRIINVTHRRVAERGDQLIREGERGEDLYIIVRGEFVVKRNGQKLAVLGAGRHFGEMALIDDRPRSASVWATEPGVVLVIRRPEFYDLLRKDATMAVKLLWNFIQTLSARLRDAPLAQAKARQLFRPPPSTTSQVLERPEFPSHVAPFGEDETGDFDDLPTDSDINPVIEHIRSLEEAIGEDITLPGLSAEKLGVDSILTTETVLNLEADGSEH
ncbi:MAG: cyclic nucleotide-binding domain-containing protein, partial [Myxococcota bacterium]